MQMKVFVGCKRHLNYILNFFWYIHFDFKSNKNQLSRICLACALGRFSKQLNKALRNMHMRQLILLWQDEDVLLSWLWLVQGWWAFLIWLLIDDFRCTLKSDGCCIFLILAITVVEFIILWTNLRCIIFQRKLKVPLLWN